MFQKVLIANRGEIAVRVARACRELGVRSVGVHSTRDKHLLTSQLFDERVQVGPAPPKLSYLNAAAILEAAQQTGADAIHPGYGFLSEDPDFADACRASEITFVGPSSEAMELLAGKMSARALATKAGVPLLPGTLDLVDDDDVESVAGEIGFPVIIKASAGGGGRGMRVVEQREDVAEAYRDTRSTARQLFGDSRVYLEKYLPGARHIEIQILCDRYQNAIYLGARDCSVQRRHQKLVEESPPPGLPADVVARMGDAALRLAGEAEYEGAGTVEFLVTEDHEFYFLEVNCRIQVEHPVTEMTTGLDLVQAQLKIASGRPLDLSQAEVRQDGVAIECRINAEDPNRQFVPTPGTLGEFLPPAGPFVRVDTYLQAGAGIPPEYDSLLAKVIAWAPDREMALARMRRALAEFRITGENVMTTRDFLVDVVNNPDFCAGEHNTSLVEHLL